MKNLFVVLISLIGFGTAQAQVPEWDWATGWGTNFNGVHDLVVDSVGNCYVIGSYLDGQQIVFDDTVSGTGQVETYIAKFDNQGVYQWLFDVPNSGTQTYSGSLVLDNENNLIAAVQGEGYLQGSDLFKIDSDGNLILQKHLTNVYVSRKSAVGVDTNNDVYVVGDSTYFNMRVMKFDENFNQLWSRGSDQANSGINGKKIVVGDDYVLLTGKANSAFTADGQAVAAGTNFLIKYDVDGNLILLGNTGASLFLSFCLDTEDNIYGIGQLPNVGTGIYVRKFNSSAQEVWSVSGGSASGSDFGYDIVASDAGVFVTAEVLGNHLHSGAVDFDTVQATAYGTMFIASSGTDGDAQWIKTQPSSDYGSAYFNTIDLDADNNIYVAGVAAMQPHFDSLSLGSNTIFPFSGYPEASVLGKLIPECNAQPISFEYSQSVGGAACDGFISVQGTNGQEPYSYQWNETGGNQTSSTIENLCPEEYCVSITDNRGCTVDTCFVLSLPVGVVNEGLPTFHLIPNPASDVLSVQMMSVFEEVRYDLFNSLGLLTKSGVLNRGVNEIDLKSVGSGLYTIVLQENNGYKYAERIVVTR